MVYSLYLAVSVLLVWYTAYTSYRDFRAPLSNGVFFRRVTIRLVAVCALFVIMSLYVQATRTPFTPPN